MDARPNPGKGVTEMRLYRAAADDIIADQASFSEDLEVARAYQSNPGFGGRNLYRAEVDIDPVELLDLAASDDQLQTLVVATGLIHPGAITADAWLAYPHVTRALIDQGIHWVRIRDTYPIDAITYTYIGGGDDPEMEEIKEE